MSEAKIVRGRYVLTDPRTGEERHFTRATNFAESLEDQTGIKRWSQRMVAVGVAQRPDMIALAQALDPDNEDDKRELNKLCWNATLVARGDVRANVGTALHKLTERVDKGELALKDVPRAQRPDIDAYIALKASFGIQTRPDYVERITVLPDYEVAGTIDRIVRWHNDVYIADLKTGNDIEKGIGKIALQLALYAHGEGLWNATSGTWEPMPSVNGLTGMIMHVPAGEPERASLWHVDIARGWSAVQLAAEVRDWRKAKDLVVKA